jgi:hypothetical protein
MRPGKGLRGNLSQRHFVHHKSYMMWDRIRASAVVSLQLTHLSYGTAILYKILFIWGLFKGDINH